MIKKYILFAFVLFLSGCGISEDCIKNAGDTVTKEYAISDFDKIRVHSGISLVVKEGPDFKVTLQSGSNIIDNIEVNKQGDFLVVKVEILAVTVTLVLDQREIFDICIRFSASVSISKPNGASVTES